jgi:predicted acylesterase/phospholipase RssA
MNKKIGFCFTGEGARGSIQAGIALGLHNKGINADFTIGISSGSVCAASYAYLGPKGLAEMWSNIKNIFGVFGINYNILGKTGLLNQKPMQKILAEAIKNKPICEGAVVRMNIENGFMDYVSNKDVSSEEFAEAVLGSVAITALVEDRNGWVDAGSRQLTPLKQCIEAGCDEIYVIMGRPLYLPTWEKPKGLFKMHKMAFRALDITLYEIMIRDINNCLRNKTDPDFKNINIFLVEPKELLFESVQFNKCKTGVEYGKTEFQICDKKALRKYINL